MTPVRRRAGSADGGTTGAAAGVLALGAGGLAAAGVLAARPGVSAAEGRAFELVARLPRAAAPGLWTVMQAGSLPAVYVAAGLALAARRPRLALDVAAAGTTAWVAAKLVKQVVGRGRPATLLSHVTEYGRPATGLGFPSGHAAVAAAMMTAAAPSLSRPARAAGWTVVALVATARMSVGAHLPLDVAGGLLLGWTVGAAPGRARGRPHARG